jgi:hypothetical protein
MIVNFNFSNNLAFQLLLFPSISNKFNFSVNLIKIIIILISFVIIVFYIGFLNGSIRNYFLTKTLVFFINIHIFFIVPIIHLFVTIFNQQSNQNSSDSSLNAIYVIFVILSTFISGLFTLFKINPFRKGSYCWNFYNKTEFYTILINISVVFILNFDTISLTFYFINIFTEMVLRS